MCTATWVGPESDTEYLIVCTYQVGPFETKRVAGAIEPLIIERR